MPNLPKSLVVIMLIFSFFCLMSRIDFIVNGTLYHYGLQFSPEWADQYWAIYVSLFALFSVTMGVMYWLGSRKTSKDLKISIGLFATINLLMIGGLQDLMFFVFWANGLPPDTVVWTWAPLSQFFGTWNSSMQVVFFTLFCAMIPPLWVPILRK